MQGLKSHPSKPPVPEECLINRLHAEKMKRRKDAAEAKAERKRKRKAKHDKACKLARAEGKPQPATPESSEEDEEEASDAEDHAPRGAGRAQAPHRSTCGTKKRERPWHERSQEPQGGRWRTSPSRVRRGGHPRRRPARSRLRPKC